MLCRAGKSRIENVAGAVPHNDLVPDIAIELRERRDDIACSENAIGRSVDAQQQPREREALSHGGTAGEKQEESGEKPHCNVLILK